MDPFVTTTTNGTHHDDHLDSNNNGLSSSTNTNSTNAAAGAPGTAQSSTGNTPAPFDPALFKTYLRALLPPVINANLEDIEGLFDDEDFDERVTRFATDVGGGAGGGHAGGGGGGVGGGLGVIYVVKVKEEDGEGQPASSALLSTSFDIDLNDDGDQPRLYSISSSFALASLLTVLTLHSLSPCRRRTDILLPAHTTPHLPPVTRHHTRVDQAFCADA